MPSTSPKQHRFMEAVAHNPAFAKKAGIPTSVGKDFAKADLKAGITKTHDGKPIARHAGASPKSAAEAMADRRGQGLTYRALASEHGTAASTAHRKVKGAALQRGYTREGSAE